MNTKDFCIVDDDGVVISDTGIGSREEQRRRHEIENRFEVNHVPDITSPEYEVHCPKCLKHLNKRSVKTYGGLCENCWLNS